MDEEKYPKWEAQTTYVDGADIYEVDWEKFISMTRSVEWRHRERMNQAWKYSKKWPRKHQGNAWELCLTYGPKITDTIMARVGVKPRLLYRIGSYFRRQK